MNFTTSLSDSSCTFFDCPLDPTYVDPNGWNIINPLAFLTDNSTLCGYVNVTSCCTLSDNGFGFLTSVCVDLLPFCIFYAFLKVMVSIMNYIFIYKKKIERRVKKPQDELLNRRYRDTYIVKLCKSLRRSFILDIISSIYNLCIFKGYQHYASHYNTDPNNDFLLGRYDSHDYVGRSVALFFGAIGWFGLECLRVFIQIFSVSSLTHIDNLKQQVISDQSNANKFYKKHEKFAFWWTLIMFLLGFTFIFCNFFFEIWTGGKGYFKNYKLHYRFYSIETISFYISYSLILILILTDRILAYDGFKKQRDLRVNERAQAMSSGQASLISLDNYQVPTYSRYFDFLKQIVEKKFTDKSPEEVERITQQLSKTYNEKMRDHYYDLKKQIKVDTSHMRSCEPSMSYVKFLRNLNIGNFVGYALILFAYQNDTGTQYLPLYMLGFGISTVTLFGFELTHNYILYKNYFLEVDRKMRFREEEDMGIL